MGVTLYYLLTGQTPFQASNVVQLLATVLERPAESPAKWRRGLPRELCRIVLRCLEKDPGERFKSYADLRDALQPYSSVAPTPATLGLRFLAGCIDALLLGCVHLGSTLLAVGGVDALVTPDIYQNPKLIFALLRNLVVAALYYGILEGRWGAAPGKAVCRLRVVGSDRNPPGFLRASLRAALFVGVSLLPGAALWSLRLDWTRPGASWIAVAVSLAQPLLMASMFVTSRRKNGFAGWHELATRTRVVLRSVPQARPALAAPESAMPNTEALPRIGPYHVLGPAVEGGDSTVLLGYDARLLRRVWIRTVPPGSPPVAPGLRQLGRPSRIRWLSGRRESTESWDAYEALTGKPLSALSGEKPGWDQARFWLLDLAEELQAAERDGSLPELDLDRVWITSGNSAKLLDFPVHGDASAQRAQEPPITPQSFLCQVAQFTCATGMSTSGDAQAGSVTPPLPLHARDLLDRFTTAPGLADILKGLKAAQHRLATVTRGRRLGLLAACATVPVLGLMLAVFSINQAGRLATAHPDYAALNVCLLHMDKLERHVRSGRAEDAGPRDAFELYIAGRFRPIIANATLWNSLPAVSSIAPSQRRLAEQIIGRRPPPTAEEITAAEMEVTRQLKGTPDEVALKLRPALKPATAGLVAGYLIGVVLVILPCWLSSLCFGGGAIVYLFGLVFLNRDGSRASRGRVLWRNVLAGLPFLLTPLAALLLAKTIGTTAAASVVVTGMVGLALVSALLPERSLQDRLAGTWLVPK